MKSTPLLIKHLHLVPLKDLFTGISKSEIQSLALEINPTYFTPGSAQLQSNQKNSAASNFWEHELAYSFPGKITDADQKIVNETGAVLCTAVDGEVMLLYKNDYYNNTRLRPEIISGQSKSSVKFAISTLYSL